MEADDDLSEALELFLKEHVESYEELETLLLLHREVAQAWSVASTAAKLGLRPEAARGALERLRARGLLSSAGAETYRCAPTDPAMAALVSELELAYRQQRIAVVQVMSKSALERLRVASLRTFAEAFRLKGSPKRG